MPKPDWSALYDTLSAFAENLAVFYMKLFLALGSLALVFLSSLIFYGIIYMLMVPKKLHTYPANLQSPNCFNVTLATKQWAGEETEFARPPVGIDLDVVLSLKLPLNQRNTGLGQILTQADIVSRTRQVIASTSTQWLVPQLSSWAHLFRDLLFAGPTAFELLNDYTEVKVMLFDGLKFSADKVNDSPSYVSVCMQGMPVFYAADLQFHSKLTGIRFLMSEYPFVSLAVFASLMAAFFISFALVSAASVYLWKRFKEEPLIKQEQDDSALMTDRFEMDGMNDQDDGDDDNGGGDHTDRGENTDENHDDEEEEDGVVSPVGPQHSPEQMIIDQDAPSDFITVRRRHRRRR